MSAIRQWVGRFAMPDDLRCREAWSALPFVSRVTALALLGWCVFMSLAAITGVVVVDRTARSKTATPAVAARAEPPSTSPAMLEAITQRPLFSRNRQQEAVVVTAQPPPVRPPPPLVALDAGLGLSGVFISDGQAKAFITTTQSPGGAWLSRDASIGGWRLVEVRAGEVEMEGSTGRVIVPFRSGAGKK